MDGLQHYVWRSKVRPHDQDSALLQNSSRENARRAALSVLCAKSEHACESLRFAWSSGDRDAERSTSANSDGDGDDREKATTADGGTFARLCVRRRRKVCRAQLEKILDVQRRSDTTFPIRAVHSTCMYSNVTSASAQLACNMIVQHVQVCWEMRWPRPSHDSWPRCTFSLEKSLPSKSRETLGHFFSQLPGSIAVAACPFDLGGDSGDCVLDSPPLSLRD